MNMAVQQKHLSPQDMLLLSVTVTCVLFGSSAGLIYENKCIGSSLSLTFLRTPPVLMGNMYFTPSGGGSRKLIMDKGEAKDPRLILSYSSAKLRDLTKRDEGTFSITYFSDKPFDVMRLNISVCSEKVTEYYGARYSGDVPGETVFLEFTPLHSQDQPVVLWNRTDPQTYIGGRVQVIRNGKSVQIHDLTQSDNGHYNFRAEDNTLLKTIKLEVKEHVSHYDVKVSDWLRLENHFGGSLWSVTFTRKDDEDDSSVSIIERGKLVRYRSNFERRLSLDNGGIEIYGVESGDSGTFEFRDQQGNLAQIAELEVEDVMDEEVPEVINIFIAVGIFFAAIVYGCWVTKSFCKKSSSNRDESTPPVYNHDSTQPACPSYSAAPAPHHSYQPVNSSVPKEPTATSLKPSVNNPVNIHVNPPQPEDSTQPAGPSNSAAPAPHHSYQPVNSSVPKEPTASSHESSVNNPVNIHVNPPQPEVAPLGGQRTNPAPALGSDCLSSDPGPQFELKGPTFLTAPPPSSDLTFSDVYSSDKLNFRSGAH